MYICTHSKNATVKDISVVFSWEENVLNEDGREYFLDIKEAIIACAKHDEEKNKKEIPHYPTAQDLLEELIGSVEKLVESTKKGIK